MFILIGCGLIVLPLIYCCVIKPTERYSFLRSDISRYTGDGTIEDISFRFTVFPVKGYSISFTPFEMGQEFSDSYGLSNLPDLDDVGVYLVVESDDYISEIEKLKLNAKVELILTDSKNQTELRVDKQLKELIWSYPHRGAISGHALYDLDKSFFSPRIGEQYTLRINYSPDENLSLRKGYVFIRCKGSL